MNNACVWNKRTCARTIEARNSARMQLAIGIGRHLALALLSYCCCCWPESLTQWRWSMQKKQQQKHEVSENAQMTHQVCPVHRHDAVLLAVFALESHQCEHHDVPSPPHSPE